MNKYTLQIVGLSQDAALEILTQLKTILKDKDAKDKDYVFSIVPQGQVTTLTNETEQVIPHKQSPVVTADEEAIKQLSPEIQEAVKKNMQQKSLKEQFKNVRPRGKISFGMPPDERALERKGR